MASNTPPKRPVPVFPADGFLRLEQIVGDPTAEPPIPAIVPISPANTSIRRHAS
jgi:hypothetical protein